MSTEPSGRDAARNLPPSENCIICGRSNPIGLHLTFWSDGNRVWSEAVAGAAFSGFEGVVHGGLLAALLDDAMWYAAFDRGLYTVTAELNIRYLEAAATGESLVVTGRVVSRRGRLVHARGEVTNREGRLLARGEGKFLTVTGDLAERFRGTWSGPVNAPPETGPDGRVKGGTRD